ncbi:ABC transporter permease [Desulfosarcina sp.]|uniref:ABC transporter permease n=1 Tax=Desulfosarcina sp. TaxID=2027861 RepID=UPI0029AC9D4D|nr:ABC transporter permease subunit [Desulfosarcina sp.]MDX2452928.1 ABC transporter permease subunit [Desulfosarcina sp.]MDX2490662.1 ABC transporter permease subunit [Desulfosarcina sp.]
MSWTTNLFLRLSPLILPYLVLFCGGVFLTVCQSVGVLTPLHHEGGALDAYARLLVDRSFYASFLFSLGVAAASAFFAVAAGTTLAYRTWQLPGRLATAALVYKIPLILPHIAVAFVVLVFWSQSGILSSVAYSLGLIQSMNEFPNVLFSGWGIGMVLAYTLKGTPFAMILTMALLVRFDIRQIQTASMLGASGLRIFFSIVLPRLAPAMHTGFIILFLYSFGAFDIPFILSESRPGMLSIHVYNLYFKHDLARRPEAMAILTIMFGFAVLFIIVYSRVVRRLESGVRKL